MRGNVVLMQVVLEGSEYITIPKKARILASGTNKSLREREKRGASEGVVAYRSGSWRRSAPFKTQYST